MKVTYELDNIFRYLQKEYNIFYNGIVNVLRADIAHVSFHRGLEASSPLFACNSQKIKNRNVDRIFKKIEHLKIMVFIFKKLFLPT